MNKSKLKTLTVEELKTRSEKLGKELIETRFDLRIGQEKDYSSIKKKKRELARINTFLRAGEMGMYTPEKKEKAEKKTKKEEKTTKIEKPKKETKKK